MQKLIQTNKQLIYLILLVLILLALSSLYIRSNSNIYIQIFGSEVNNSNNKSVYTDNDEIYISLDILRQYIDSDIFYDKASNYITITNNGQILKLKIGDSRASLNYKEITIENPVVKNDNEIYLPVSNIKEIYNIDGAINKDKQVYILNNNVEMVSVKNNDKIYKIADNKSQVNGALKKKDIITAYYNLVDSEWLLVKTENGQVGYIQKYNLTKKTMDKINSKVEILRKQEDVNLANHNSDKINGIVYTYGNVSSNIYKQNNIDSMFIESFEVLKINGQVDTNNINQSIIDTYKKDNYKVYGIMTNGYNSSNFDNTSISTVINNPNTRDILITNIFKELEKYKLNGLVVDFESIKKSDEEIYVQFLKELGTIMKKNDKKILVKSISNNNDIDISKALKYLDYYIIEGYNHRNIDSNISGTDSDINKINKDVDNILAINNGEYKSKIILELPMYSILWEEKESKVINSSIYNQNASLDFINKNKLVKKIDIKTNQNYVEITKGIITYKIWVEDEYSIKEKVKIAKEKDLAGVILYRSGYENEELINKILK